MDRTQSQARYEEDFARWSAEQAALLRSGHFQEVDLANVAEEIESLGRSDKRQIESRIGVILLHLLKWQFHIRGRETGWLLTLDEQRDRVARLINESPSLKRVPQESLEPEFRLARRKASKATELPLSSFPEICPYAIDQILSLDFLPGPEWTRKSDFRD